MSATPDDKGKALLARPGIGLTARVVQRSDLRFSRIVVDRPALILLRHGTKLLESARGQWSLKGGEAIAIAGGQTFDVTNRLSDRGLYEAQWLVWDPSVIARFERTATGGHHLEGGAALGKVDAEFASAFDRARDAIADVRHVPDDVAAHRLTEMLVWLSLRGIHFSAAENPSLAAKVRRLLETALAEPWTAPVAAKRLALSEATLRRRLAAEGTSFGDLLTDVRMSYAMLLLQSTEYAVNRIALEVGYESASRFAIRFRERFGFPPTAIRGHARDCPPDGGSVVRNGSDQAVTELN
ncbi:MAG: helix-turn-helix transcriptional regulator [Ferrovibrio sp.]|uniref:helix-turn-helix transcriptional regulator n=1 Tax=Ferrovibrio sp. TaxID=1917215 RepID=UPI00261D3940|nr:helix-turn-helix transcriptional regulator [Ferrovibrio sp.]MCW0232158.1 helix-turn-helix transcriptional regulator [Ferrovibrio sp.]